MRPELDTSQGNVKFQNEKYPTVHYNFLHPCLVTNNADSLILPASKGKQVAIPVHKDLLKTIPYFKGQFNNNSNWKDTVH